MPLVARKGDMAGGPISAPCSPNVLINGIPAALLGDVVAPHGPYPKPASNIVHQASPKLVSGSGSVIVNGKPLVRKGDSVSCGHSVTGSSSNVSAG